MMMMKVAHIRMLQIIFSLLFFSQIYVNYNSNITLNIGMWNMRGLTLSKPYLKWLMNQCQIVAISEYKLFDYALKNLKTINKDYEVLSCSRPFSRHLNNRNEFHMYGSGGIALFLRKDVGINIIPHLWEMTEYVY